MPTIVYRFLSANGIALIAALTMTAAAFGDSGKPSFRQDVLPVLTKMGCNAGSCHGKLAGQNGFKLSLRAYAPEWDYEWLTQDLSSRRINFAEPDRSLLIQKPLGNVPHEGGKRFAENSPSHRVLRAWIAARCPGPDAKEADASSLEVTPASRVMRVGAALQLKVVAHYPDGRARDVTWMGNFFSNDEATVSVSPDGVVKSLRSGETAVRVHFQGQVAIVIVTTPYDNSVSPGQFAAKNNLIDEHVFRKLEALRIPPSRLCDDATFIRRAFLDTIGTLPTPQEVRTFLEDARADKRARLIDQLLSRPEYVDYWTLQLDDLLQNRKERDHDVRGTKGLRSFQTWLRGQVAANRPWNELTRDVVLASGDSVTHPEVGYFITTVGEKTPAESEVVDSVAQAFMGVRIGCARCHNHPLERYTQDDYYHFAAFFARVSMKRQSPETGPTTLNVETREEQEKKKQIAEAEKGLAEAQKAAEGKTGEEAKKSAAKVAEQTKRAEDARKELEKLAARVPTVTQLRTKQQMLPQALDRMKIELKPGEDPRRILADWMTNPRNEEFGGCMVNRLWKHFLSVGLVEQVDDLRSSNPPSNPELWKALTGEFVSHGYDLKHVMRLILNSRTYQLSSITEAGNEADRRFYSHYYARRLPAEVMLDAISQATAMPDKFSGYPVGTRAIQLPEPGVSSYFLTLFGRSDRVTACACERTGEVTLPQLLHLQNGDDVLKKIRANDGRVAALVKNPDDSRVTDELFLAALGRHPSPNETAAVNKGLSAGDPREDVYRDLLWALMNTKEFAFNH